MGVQVVQHDVDPGLAIDRGHLIDEREEIRSGARFGAPSQYFPGACVEAGKQAAGAVAPVLEVHAPRPVRLWSLELTAARKSLHARLLVDTQHRLASGALNVESDDRAHLLLKLRVLAVTQLRTRWGLISASSRIRPISLVLISRTSAAAINASRSDVGVHTAWANPKSIGERQAAAITW